MADKYLLRCKEVISKGFYTKARVKPAEFKHRSM
jgi:hypothetical protein